MRNITGRLLGSVSTVVITELVHVHVVVTKPVRVRHPDATVCATPSRRHHRASLTLDAVVFGAQLARGLPHHVATGLRAAGAPRPCVHGASTPCPRASPGHTASFEAAWSCCAACVHAPAACMLGSASLPRATLPPTRLARPRSRVTEPLSAAREAKPRHGPRLGHPEPTSRHACWPHRWGCCSAPHGATSCMHVAELLLGATPPCAVCTFSVPPHWAALLTGIATSTSSSCRAWPRPWLLHHTRWPR